VTTEQGLTTEEYNHLALLGQLVTHAAPEHQHTAITVAVDHITRYRDHATWDDIATALGITTTRLREWRDQAVSTAKSHNLAPLPPRLYRTTVPNATLLIITGHPNAQPGQTNDFTTETATIRHHAKTHFDVHDIAGIALNEVGHAIQRYAPAILHIAAHSDYGDVFLTHSTTPLPVPRTILADAITRATPKPTLVVLNFCGSVDLAYRLATDGYAVVTWPGKVLDTQAQEFAQTFYHSLAAGHPLGAAFDDTTITLARYADLLKPNLNGDRSMRFR
jgi:hypothetical protein